MRIQPAPVPGRIGPAALLLLLGCASGCVSAGYSREAWTITATPLFVENRTWRDIDVYDAAELSTRLGRVSAFRREWLAIGRERGAVRLVLKPRGADAGFSLETVWVAPGQIVEVQVNPLLEASELRVRSLPGRPRPDAERIVRRVAAVRESHELRRGPRARTVGSVRVTTSIPRECAKSSSRLPRRPYA